jgi:branched-chain amino acid transport system substrate-binding protein
MTDKTGSTMRRLLAGGSLAVLTVAMAATVPGMARADGTPFRIGALNPVTGAGSPYGPGMQKVIVMAAEEVNQTGGVCGRMLEVTAEDTQTSPDAAVLAVKKLIEVNGAQVIMGTWSSGVTLAVMPITTAAGIPELNTSGAPAISMEDKDDMVWRFQATNDRFGQAFAKIATMRGFKRPATMAYNNASGIGNTEGFTKAWTAGGGEVVSAVVYEPKRPSYRSELQQILAANPDVVVMGSYLQDTTVILREWFQSGQSPDLKWIIPGWAANQQLIDALGPEVAASIISVDSISNETAPSYDHFAAAYQAATGSPASGNVYAAMTYDMVISWGLAMQAACPDTAPKAINAAIRSIDSADGEPVYTFAEGKAAIEAGKTVNYEGASSRLSFDQYGDVTPDFSLSEIEGTSFVRKDVVKF